MRENRGPWYLITGFILGAAIGLAYAWVFQPVEYTNTTPASLRADFKDQYRALIASAYQADGDLVRARARLDLLKDQDVYRILAEQAQRTLAEGKAPQEARALGMLAVALGKPPSTLSAPAGGPSGTPATTTVSATLTLTATFTITPAGGTPSPESRKTPTVPAASPTITLLPTRTSTPTSGAPFALKSEELTCKPDQGAALIIVQTYDAAKQGVPGVEVVVNWEGGENHFFTGLKPELGLGYADFTMTSGVIYTLRLAEGGQIIPNLTPTECEDQDGGRYWGSWLLVFEQP